MKLLRPLRHLALEGYGISAIFTCRICHRYLFSHSVATWRFARDSFKVLLIYSCIRESIGSRTAVCPTFVTRSGPCYPSFPLHGEGRDSGRFLRMPTHFYDFTVIWNTPQLRVLTNCMLNRHLLVVDTCHVVGIMHLYRSWPIVPFTQPLCKRHTKQRFRQCFV